MPLTETDEILEFTNDELLAALQDVARHPTPEALRGFYAALNNSTLIVLAPPEAGDGEGSAFEEASDDIPLLTFVNDADEAILVAFSDEEAVLAWDPDSPALVALRGLDLLLIAAQNNIDVVMINPGSPASYRMYRDEFAPAASGDASVLQGTARQLPVGTTVYIAPPEIEPSEGWFRTVRSVLESYPSIVSAYFFLMRLAPAGARHVVGLALHEGMTSSAQSALVDAVLMEFESLLPDGWTLDFVVLDDPDFLDSVRDTVPPIFSAA